MSQLEVLPAQQLLLEQAVKNVEDQLDNTLQALDNMDPDDLEAMRQRRLDQMKRAAAQRQEWSRKGHGEYKEIFGERGFFAEMKGEERMVCHFYRENWPCKVGHPIPSAAVTYNCGDFLPSLLERGCSDGCFEAHHGGACIHGLRKLPAAHGRGRIHTRRRMHALSLTKAGHAGLLNA